MQSTRESAVVSWESVNNDNDNVSPPSTPVSGKLSSPIVVEWNKDSQNVALKPPCIKTQYHESKKNKVDNDMSYNHNSGSTRRALNFVNE